MVIEKDSLLKGDCESNESVLLSKSVRLKQAGMTQARQLSQRAAAPWRLTTLMLRVSED